MSPEQIDDFLTRVIDGQTITVTTVSGNSFRGIYVGEDTDDTHLVWESFEGRTFRAKWENVDTVAYASARAAISTRFNIPPEHPLSGQPVKVRRAYTVRNP